MHVRLVDYRSSAAGLHAVRHAVFVEEQGIGAALEQDGQDAICWHALALTDDGQPIGAGRLLPDGRIGRMAVLPGWRGQGIGEHLLEVLCRQGRDAGLGRLTLHAQLAAQPLYVRGGFLPEGHIHIEAGLPHQTMVRHLAMPTPLASDAQRRAALACLLHRSRSRLTGYCTAEGAPLLAAALDQHLGRPDAALPAAMDLFVPGAMPPLPPAIRIQRLSCTTSHLPDLWLVNERNDWLCWPSHSVGQTHLDDSQGAGTVRSGLAMLEKMSIPSSHP